MAEARCNLTIQDEDGNILDGASVEVRNALTLALPPLHSDRAGTVSIGNPFTAADGADAGFHVVGGVYKITATLGAFTRIWPYVGIGLASESDLTAAEVQAAFGLPTIGIDDANNTSVVSPVRLRHTTSGTPGVGIGVGLEFEVETASGNNEIGARIDAVTTDVGAGTENFDLVFRGMVDGTLAELIRFTSAGAQSSTISAPGFLLISATADLGAPGSGPDIQLVAGDDIIMNPGSGTGSTGGSFKVNNGTENLISASLGTFITNDNTISGSPPGGGASALPSHALEVKHRDSSTNTVPAVLSVQRYSSGTPGTGIGAAIEFKIQTDAAGAPNAEIGALIECVSTDLTGASEDFDLVFKTMVAGAAATERARLKSTGLFLPLSSVIDFNSGDVVINSTGNILSFVGASTGYLFDSLVRVPLVIGGGSVGSDLTLRTTTAAGDGTDLIIFQRGTDGSVEMARMGIGSGAVSSGIGLNTTTIQDNFITLGALPSVGGGFTIARNTAGGVGVGASFAAGGAALAGTNLAGAGITFVAGRGTGNAVSQATSFYGYAPVASGTGEQTLTQEMQLNAANVYFPAAGTTASAANAFLNSGSSPVNELLRSTSSLRYKRDVQPLEFERAKMFLQQAEPIWYRSGIKNDRQDWSWYGFAAEDVAAIDPRLVSWGYRDEDWETIEIEGGGLPPGESPLTKRVPRLGAKMVPDGVMYERITVMHQAILQDHEQRLVALEA